MAVSRDDEHFAHGIVFGVPCPTRYYYVIEEYASIIPDGSGGTDADNDIFKMIRRRHVHLYAFRGLMVFSGQ